MASAGWICSAENMMMAECSHTARWPARRANECVECLAEWVESALRAAPAPVVAPATEREAVTMDRGDLQDAWRFLHMLKQRVGALGDDDRAEAERLFHAVDAALAAAPLPVEGNRKLTANSAPLPVETLRDNAPLDPDKCDEEVFRHGEDVGVYGSLSRPEAQRLCADLRALTGWRWDWNYAAGRVVLRVLRGLPVETDATPAPCAYCMKVPGTHYAKHGAKRERWACAACAPAPAPLDDGGAKCTCGHPKGDHGVMSGRCLHGSCCECKCEAFARALDDGETGGEPPDDADLRVNLAECARIRSTVGCVGVACPDCPAARGPSGTPGGGT